MEAIDFKSADHMARHLATYITDAGTIENHVRNNWGRAPNRETIAAWQEEHSKRNRIVETPHLGPEGDRALANDDGSHWRPKVIMPKAKRISDCGDKGLSDAQLAGFRKIADANRRKAQENYAASLPVGAQILQRVADYFEVTISDMKSKGRKEHLVTPRHVAMNLLHSLRFATGEKRFSYPNIARLCGRSDHSTVIHAVQTFPDRSRKYPIAMRAYHDIFDALEVDGRFTLVRIHPL